ncbi:MAG TPA: M48 family metallopeptidase [Dissulfurispiraceae bacterium]|nr:M48 family metallopeptidase [Dissulfurispiraceae bacterium]
MATFFDLQAQNRRKTRIVVVCFVLFFIWLGMGLDLAIYYLSGSSHSVYALSPKPRKHFYPVFTVIIGLAGIGIAWWNVSNAPNTVLKAMMARPADKRRSAQEMAFLNVVEEMSIASSIAPPQVWLIPDPDPNALAVGMREGDYHIAVTTGLLNVLTRDELQGVVAHEIAHLKNQDTRLMTTLTVLVGLAALISEFVARTRLRLDWDDGDNRDSRIGVVILILWFLSVLLAPIATNLMALMVSREREYLADASSAQFTRNPEGLAHALEKIARATGPTASVKPASAHLCIASPEATDLSDDSEPGWFATHPPIKQRIQRLMSIGRAAAPAA